jgi:membrane protease YdiL (CAAX protease family)
MLSFAFVGTLVEAGLGPLAMGIGWALGVDPLRVSEWRVVDLTWGLGATVPMLFGFMACLHTSWRPLREIRTFMEEIVCPTLAGSHPLTLAALCLAAGFGEETLFRGLIQGGLDRVIGPWFAVVISSLLFGLAHPISRAYVVIAMLLGLYLGALRMAGASLLVLIAAHALYDFVALAWLLRSMPPGTKPGGKSSITPQTGAPFAPSRETIDEAGTSLQAATTTLCWVL